MIQDLIIDEELKRIKRNVEDLELKSKWGTNMNTALEADEELEQIYNKLKEV